jgi:hypothetical protein
MNSQEFSSEEFFCEICPSTNVAATRLPYNSHFSEWPSFNLGLSHEELLYWNRHFG